MDISKENVIYCLKHSQLSDCLTCPHYVDVDKSLSECRKQRISEGVRIIEDYQRIEYDHKKIEKISAILKTAKADPTRDEYAEYYLDAIEEVVRWTQI